MHVYTVLRTDAFIIWPARTFPCPNATILQFERPLQSRFSDRGRCANGVLPSTSAYGDPSSTRARCIFSKQRHCKYRWTESGMAPAHDQYHGQVGSSLGVQSLLLTIMLVPVVYRCRSSARGFTAIMNRPWVHHIDGCIISLIATVSTCTAPYSNQQKHMRRRISV